MYALLASIGGLPLSEQRWRRGGLGREWDRRKVEGGEMRGLGRGSGHQDAVNEKHH